MKKFFFLFFAAVSIACAQLAVPWADVDKTGSSLADFGTRSAADLTTGTLNAARLPSTIPQVMAFGDNITLATAKNIFWVNGNIRIGADQPTAVLTLATDGGSSNYISLQAAGSERLRVASGVTTVTGNASVSGAGTFGSDLTAAGASGTLLNVDVTSGAGNPLLSLKIAGATKGLVGIAGATNSIITGTAAGDMAFRTATQKMLFSANGGTTAHVTLATNGDIAFASANDSTLYTNGGATLAGGIGVAKNINSGQKIAATQDLVIGSTTTGASVASALNSRDSRGGLAFDGTPGNNFTATLSNQSITTDPFSLSFVFRVPTAAPSTAAFLAFIASAASADTANDFSIALESSGALRFVLRGSPTTNSNVADLASFVANYGGRVVHLVAVRPASGNLAVYVNGVAQALSFSTGGTPPTWQGSVTSTYLVVGKFDGSFYPWSGTIYAASLYNLALDQASITELVELGGSVPERFKWGSQQALASVSRNSDMSAGATDWANWGTGTVSVSGGKLVATNFVNDGGPFMGTTSAFGALTDGLGIRRDILVSITFTLSGLTSGDVRPTLFGGTAVQNNAVVASADGTYTADFNVQSRSLRSVYVGFLSYGSGTRSFELDNIIFKVRACIAHYDPECDGIGYQLHDQGPNKLDAGVTTTGAYWTKPARRGYVRGTLTWSASHAAQSLLGQTALESDCVVEDFTAKFTGASSGSGVTLGTTNSATRYLSATPFTTVKFRKRGSEISNGGVPAGTAAGDLDLLIDPDTANISASGQFNLVIVRSEGAP